MLEKIIAILSEYTDIDPEKITEKTDFEEEFNVTVSDRDAMNLQTVGDVIRFVEMRK